MTVKQVVLSFINEGKKDREEIRENTLRFLSKRFPKLDIVKLKVKEHSNFYSISSMDDVLKQDSKGFYSLTKSGKSYLKLKDLETPNSLENPVQKKKLRATIKTIETKEGNNDINITTFANSIVQVVSMGDQKQIKINGVVVFSNLNKEEILQLIN